MGKQTMGTACHNWPLIADTKLYRLQTPSSPLFRPIFHDLLQLDDFAMGTNAIVAVISYTVRAREYFHYFISESHYKVFLQGYDMEDAMIINKASLERGFAHGSIYKCDTIELKVKIVIFLYHQSSGFILTKIFLELRRIPILLWIRLRKSYMKNWTETGYHLLARDSNLMISIIGSLK